LKESHSSTDPARVAAADQLDSLMERKTIGPLRGGLFLICFAAALMDGVHIQAMGLVGVQLSADIAISPQRLGLLLSASELGFMLGALLLSPLADRFGRKIALVLSVLTFGGFSFLTAYSHTFESVMVSRLGTGLGLGTAGPAIVSLATEYVAARHRARLSTLIWAALPAGGIVGGALAGLIVPHLGWRSFFLAVGVLSTGIAALVMIWVPESLRFLVHRQPGDVRIVGIIKRLGGDPAVITASLNTSAPSDSAGVPLRLLFAAGRGSFTVLLWLSFIFCFMSLLAVLTWTVSLLQREGLTLQAAANVITVNNVGGTFGVASAGYLMERFGGTRLLLGALVAGGAAIACTGLAASFLTMAICALFTGLLAGGASAGLIALAASGYPTAIRATGIGWGLAAGRLGGAAGPALLGWLANAGASPLALFCYAGVPILLAGCAVAPLARRGSRGSLMASVIPG
jgi:AAHS family 4-hydroxybenzoate transporter-like MFS transporter